MKNFTTVADVAKPSTLIQQVKELISQPSQSDAGRGKTLGLIFFNPSLRTRLSSQQSAQKLGMNVIVLNISADAWQVEFEDGAVMNGRSEELIKDTVKFISSYCDIMGV